MTGEKLCQSCAMPLTEESLLGTNAERHQKRGVLHLLL